MTESLDVVVEKYARELAAASFPQVSDVPGLSALRRKWVLRVGKTLPTGEILNDIMNSFELKIRRLIIDALELPANASLTLPVVSAVRLDDSHLVLEIDCPDGELRKGDEPAIATFGILRAADEQWQIEDIQGIPKRYWFIIGSYPTAANGGVSP